MATALGDAASGFQLFQGVILVFRRIIKAYKQQKQLSGFLVEYKRELEWVRDLAESVRIEKALEGAKLSETLIKLKDLEDKLCHWLAKVDPGDRSSGSLLAEQLIRGQKYRTELDEIMSKLHRVKADLILKISVHQAKMSHEMSQSDAMKNNKKVLVGLKPKSTAGLANIIRPAKARTSTRLTHGENSLDSEDDDSSTEDSEPQTPVSNVTHVRKTRIVKNNKVQKDGTMVNGPVGKDLWKDMDHVEIEGNECGEGGMMINYRIDKQGILIVRKDWEARLVARRQQDM